MSYTFENEVISAEEEGLSFEGREASWDTAEDAKDVVEALEEQKIVHYLKLGGNTLGVNAASVIGKALERHSEFRKALWKDMFTRRLKTEIPSALKYLGQGLMKAMAQLTVLDLSDNALGPNGMKGLEEFLRSSVCYTLQELHMNNCGLGIYGGRMLSKAVRDCLENSSKAGTPINLKVFIAGRNRLENEGAKAIGEMLTELQTLEVIAMPQNSIYHHGIEMLAEGISCNHNLCVLNLNDNTVTSKGAPYLAQAISNTPLLRELNLGDCLLKTDGAICIAEVLEESHLDLEVVNLSFNEMKTNGGLIVAAAMKNKPNLKQLILDGNQFGQNGLDNIIEEMQSAVNPEALVDMPDNQSDSDEEDEDGYSDEDDDDATGDNDEDETVEDDDDVYADQGDFGEYAAEETVYTTTKEFAGISGNESLFSSKSFLITPTKALPTVETSATTTTMPTAKITNSQPVELFCLSQKPCTKEMFEAVKVQDKFKAFMGIINQFQGDNHLLLLIFTALKCAHLSQDIPEALDLAVEFYTHIIEYAVKTQQERRTTNYILMQLGLLRCEEKFKTEYNLDNCCKALQKALSKDSLTSNYMVDTFKVFLDNNSNKNMK